MSHTTGYLHHKINLLKRLTVFIQERFEPISHLLMIFVFWWAHLLITEQTSGLAQNFLIFWGSTAFFLKLRFYDEIKDYDTDKIINPNRPLARGLLSIDETKSMIIISIIFILISFSLVSLKALPAMALAVAYGVLMYYEFFIPKLIRPHLTTYATTHTIVTFFLSMAILCAHRDLYLWQLPLSDALFGLMSWMLFNIFELGRKTYQKSEERTGVDTYSLVWTRPGAVALVLIQAVIAVLIGPFVGSSLFIAWIIVATLATSGIWYITDKRVISAKIYRLMSSFIIVLIYLNIIYAQTYARNF
jgi:4-hydroxybenzoate polyprenyltransferase